MENQPSRDDISSERTVVESSPGAPRDKADTQQERISVPDVNIQNVVAWGGMAAVYKGVQPFLSRTVAVKVLRQTAQWDESLTERFQLEARLLAGLDHPHIVPCHSAGKLADGRCYLVMEFVEGPNLSEFVNSHGPLAEREALRLIRDMAAALQHATDRGIIHRDVKPQNILLKPISSQDGRTDAFPFISKLSDLGVARYESGEANSSGADLTQKGQFVGTPAYMAPEQFDDAANVDHRADIYGLGGVLYFALSGTSPYSSQSVSDIIRRKSFGQLRSLREVVPTITSAAEQLASDMLAPEKEKRPENYAEVIRRCDAALAPTATPHVEPQPTSRMKLLVPIGAVLAVAVMLVLIALARPNAKEVASTIPAAKPTVTAKPTPTPTPAPTATPTPTPIPQVRVALEFAAPPTPLLAGDFLKRLDGWNSVGAFAPDDESEDGAIGASVGTVPATLTRALPPAPWRFEGRLDVSNGRDGGLRLDTPNGTVSLRLQNLGSSALARIETDSGSSSALGSFDSADERAFIATFDGVDLVLQLGDLKQTIPSATPTAISLVAWQGPAGFHGVMWQDGGSAANAN